MAIPVLPDESIRVRDRYHRIRRLVVFLVGIGVIFQIAGRQIFFATDSGSWWGWEEAWMVGTIFHVAACVLFARVKGRSSGFGLVGVFGVFGVLGLVLMDSRCHRCGRPESRSCRECPGCGAPM